MRRDFHVPKDKNPSSFLDNIYKRIEECVKAYCRREKIDFTLNKEKNIFDPECFNYEITSPFNIEVKLIGLSYKSVMLKTKEKLPRTLDECIKRKLMDLL